MDIVYFKSSDEFRAWLEANHNHGLEVRVGLYKKGSGKTGITYPEARDQALCFGWIDGITHKVDDESYTIRFTPRKRGSIWSNVNIKLVSELTEQGLMHPSGLKVFEERDVSKSNSYSYERENTKLDSAYLKQFKANKTAREFFQSQPPSYQEPAIWWVMSAKKEETRQKRLNILIEDSANGLKIASLRR